MTGSVDGASGGGFQFRGLRRSGDGGCLVVLRGPLQRDSRVSGEPTLDPAALDRLLEITGDDVAFVDELIDTYLEDAVVQLAAMDDAAATGDAAALVRPAHSLKSNSDNVGAVALTVLCRALETDARGGEVADADRAGRRDPPRVRGRAGWLLEARAATVSRRSAWPSIAAQPRLRRRDARPRPRGRPGSCPGRRSPPARPSRQEELDHLDVAVLRGLVERRVPAMLRGVDVGAGRQQDAADLEVPARRGSMERLVRRSLRVYGRPRRPRSSSRRAASAFPKKAAKWRAVKPSGENAAGGRVRPSRSRRRST